MKIEERAVLIRIGAGWTRRWTDPELYEKVRKWWRVDPRRDPDFAFAVHQGVVLAVYSIDGWDPHPHTSRWAFHGSREEELTRRYGGAAIRHYFPRGAANPIRYVNC